MAARRGEARREVRIREGPDDRIPLDVPIVVVDRHVENVLRTPTSQAVSSSERAGLRVGVAHPLTVNGQRQRQADDVHLAEHFEQPEFGRGVADERQGGTGDGCVSL